LGLKCLSDVGYYCDDLLMKRVLGLRTLPHVSTVSRTLAGMDTGCVDSLRALTRDLPVYLHASQGEEPAEGAAAA
jgi:hypothetical protein